MEWSNGAITKICQNSLEFFIDSHNNESHEHNVGEEEAHGEVPNGEKGRKPLEF